MVGPLFLFITVFAAGLVVQSVFTGHRLAAAVMTTLTPLVIIMLTVWWGIWDHDALWIVGVFFAFLDCAAASIASALLLRTLKWPHRPGPPNVR
jgi:hypothetical protein